MATEEKMTRSRAEQSWESAWPPSGKSSRSGGPIPWTDGEARPHLHLEPLHLEWALGELKGGFSTVRQATSKLYPLAVLAVRGVLRVEAERLSPAQGLKSEWPQAGFDV